MSDKQLSPIAKALDFYERNKTLFSPEALLHVMEAKLNFLLEEEKKFAEDAFNAGCAITAQIWDEWCKKITEPEFEDYYKKY